MQSGRINAWAKLEHVTACGLGNADDGISLQDASTLLNRVHPACQTTPVAFVGEVVCRDHIFVHPSDWHTVVRSMENATTNAGLSKPVARKLWSDSFAADVRTLQPLCGEVAVEQMLWQQKVGRKAWVPNGTSNKLRPIVRDTAEALQPEDYAIQCQCNAVIHWRGACFEWTRCTGIRRARGRRSRTR